MAFSPDGKTLATAGDDQTIKLWDAATGHPWATPTAHHDRVVAVVFTPDGRQVISCGREGNAIVWDLATFRERNSFVVSNGNIQSLAISPDGSLVAVAGNRIVICNLPGGRETFPLGNPDNNQINSVAFFTTGRHWPPRAGVAR